jgi:hypothetical protein
MYPMYCVGEIETCVLRSKVLGKSCSGRENEETFGGELQATNNNKMRRIGCLINSADRNCNKEHFLHFNSGNG